jgi:spore maturation protein CgeB
VTDHWEGIELFLEPDREVIVAHSGAEVAERLDRLTPGDAREIGLASQRRLLAEHTYDHRAAQLERLLDATRAASGGIAG